MMTISHDLWRNKKSCKYAIHLGGRDLDDAPTTFLLSLHPPYCPHAGEAHLKMLLPPAFALEKYQDKSTWYSVLLVTTDEIMAKSVCENSNNNDNNNSDNNDNNTSILVYVL